MTERHLSDLENALAQDHWRVFDRLEGDGYRISAFWKIARPDGADAVTLAFSGLDDMQTLPIEQAYGCTAQGVPGGDLYFARGASWRRNLRAFIEALARHTANDP